VATFIADLSSQASVRRLAAEVLARYPKLDVLVNNAGAMYGTQQLTEDGIELTWGVNHPGAVSAQQAPPPTAEGERASTHHHHTQAHQGAHIPFDDLNAERSYRGFGRYCETKLANILFTIELARRLRGSGVTANCFHPGLVAAQAGVTQPGEGRRNPCVACHLARPCECERGDTSLTRSKSREPRGTGHRNREAAVGNQRATVRGPEAR